MHLYGIHVLPAWQSRGIGSSILDSLKAEATARDVPFRLRVLKVNPRAKALYERHGFRVTEETETHHHLEWCGDDSQ